LVTEKEPSDYNTKTKQYKIIINNNNKVQHTTVYTCGRSSVIGLKSDTEHFWSTGLRKQNMSCEIMPEGF